MGFPQRFIGEFISSKLRSSAAGLALPEFSKKQEPRRTEKVGDIFRAFSILVCSLNPWTWRHYIRSKLRKTLTYRQMITSQKTKSLVYDYFGAKLATLSTSFLLYSSVSIRHVLCHLSVNSATNLSLSAHGSSRFLQWINVGKRGRENGHRVDYPPPYHSQQRQNFFI